MIIICTICNFAFFRVYDFAISHLKRHITLLSPLIYIYRLFVHIYIYIAAPLGKSSENLKSDLGTVLIDIVTCGATQGDLASRQAPIFLCSKLWKYMYCLFKKNIMSNVRCVDGKINIHTPRSKSRNKGGKRRDFRLLLASVSFSSANLLIILNSGRSESMFIVGFDTCHF